MDRVGKGEGWLPGWTTKEVRHSQMIQTTGMVERRMRVVWRSTHNNTGYNRDDKVERRYGRKQFHFHG